MSSLTWPSVALIQSSDLVRGWTGVKILKLGADSRRGVTDTSAAGSSTAHAQSSVDGLQRHLKCGTWIDQFMAGLPTDKPRCYVGSSPSFVLWTLTSRDTAASRKAWQVTARLHDCDRPGLINFEWENGSGLTFFKPRNVLLSRAASAATQRCHLLCLQASRLTRG